MPDTEQNFIKRKSSNVYIKNKIKLKREREEEKKKEEENLQTTSITSDGKVSVTTSTGFEFSI